MISNLNYNSQKSNTQSSNNSIYGGVYPINQMPFGYSHPSIIENNTIENAGINSNYVNSFQNQQFLQSYPNQQLAQNPFLNINTSLNMGSRVPLPNPMTQINQ